MKINLKDKKVIILSASILIIIIFLLVYFKIISMYRNNNIFANEAEKYAEEVDNPVFTLEKVLIYSDANVEDLSENKNLSDVNVSQFTDFAIYINNKTRSKELTPENTVNKIYIDDISISDTSIGNQKIFYKGINDLCKYKDILENTKRIDYKVIHTNEQKEDILDENKFFTDCSEPIVVSYVNSNIAEHRDISNSNERLSLDGSILKYLDIKLEDLNYKITFTINIENNLGELYKCKYSIDINLNSSDGGMYTGYIMQIQDMSNTNCKFRKVNT